MRRALVCGAGGFMGGHPENFGSRIANFGLERTGYGSRPRSLGNKSEILNPKSEMRDGCGLPALRIADHRLNRDVTDSVSHLGPLGNLWLPRVLHGGPRCL
jgi:hypothetical protein